MNYVLASAYALGSADHYLNHSVPQVCGLLGVGFVGVPGLSMWFLRGLGAGLLEAPKGSCAHIYIYIYI